MHQTFYIDVDEEISSVIDRLNKSMSIESYFVVPKRALFFQSIVNLKILKREADKVGKIVVIVTQDEVGSSMAGRAGIEVRENLDGLEHTVPEEIVSLENEIGEQKDAEEFEYGSEFLPKQDKQIRLNNIGSGDFYQQNENHLKQENKIKSPQRNAERVAPVQNKTLKRAAVQKSLPRKIVLEKKEMPVAKKQVTLNHGLPSKPVQGKLPNSMGNSFAKLDPQKSESLERMFSGQQQYAPVKNQSSQPNQPKQISSGNLRKVFVGFMLIVTVVLVGAAGYLFLPSAKIFISSNVSVQKINEDVSAGANISQVDRSEIPLRVIDQEQQIAISYNVEGKAVVSGKKAHGKVVIYNEFSNEPQTLIATTRLQSADGKIFRINKNVVVPGYSNVAGQIKPGAIQTEITADVAGSEYNIDATKFTIPGFAESVKFDKFYANSTESMVGGSMDGQTATGGAITQGDLDIARQKTESIFKEKMAELIKSQLSESEIALTQAQKISITRSNATAKVGTSIDSFDWVVVGSIRALVFSENDIRTVISSTKKQDSDVKQEISKLDYGSGDPDFDALTLKFKVYGDITSTPTIDSEKIKKELLGKKDDQLADILKKYPSIRSANVEFTPTFISRVPQYSSRVMVEIKNEAQ